MGEAVVVFNRADNHAAQILQYVRKQATQLYSKSRFIAAQFEAYLKDDLYLKLAGQSNAMAKYLAEQLKDIPQIKISKSVDSNSVFAVIPVALTEELLKKHYFYIWDETINEVRWMCSFSTTKEDIDLFVKDIKGLL